MTLLFCVFLSLKHYVSMLQYSIEYTAVTCLPATVHSLLYV
jgi:hypothetical protein